MVYELSLNKILFKRERTGNEGHEVAKARQLGVPAEDKDQTEMGKLAEDKRRKTRRKFRLREGSSTVWINISEGER